jgi:single-stranded DNA-binding protein
MMMVASIFKRDAAPGYPASGRKRVVTFTVNKVILAGSIGDYGAKVTYRPSGKPELTFSLILEKPVGAKVFKTFLPVQVYGAQAEALAETLQPGDVVLLDGKLASCAGKTKDSDKLVVVCSAVEILIQATTSA